MMLGDRRDEEEGGTTNERLMWQGRGERDGGEDGRDKRERDS